MLTLRRKTDYALVALASLARGQAVRTQRPAMSARQIAQEFGLPLPLTMVILKKLHREGLIESTRGSHGGYRLARPASRIRLTEVIECIEGPLQLAPCCDDGQAQPCQACRISPKCPVRDRIRQISGQIFDFLQQHTLADLVTEQTRLAPLRIQRATL